MEAKSIGCIQGIKLGGSVLLIDLLFVDDILLFSNGLEREARKLQDTFNTNCVAT